MITQNIFKIKGKSIVLIKHNDLYTVSVYEKRDGRTNESFCGACANVWFKKPDEALALGNMITSSVHPGFGGNLIEEFQLTKPGYKFFQVFVYANLKYKVLCSESGSIAGHRSLVKSIYDRLDLLTDEEYDRVRKTGMSVVVSEEWIPEEGQNEEE